MNTDWLKRERLILGNENVENFKHLHVLVVGVGGVGAYVAEQLCRAGIGKLSIVDGDVVELSNKNRQLLALDSNLGQSKAGVMGRRLSDINPEVELHIYNEYIKDERIDEILDLYPYDYVVDAIDTLSPKLYLIYKCVKKGLKLVSSMGSGGKTDPSKIRVADISETYNCPLARTLRKRLHKLGVYKGVKVVFSSEEPHKDAVLLEDGKNQKSIVGTVSYMPPAFGCFIVSAVIMDVVGNNNG